MPPGLERERGKRKKGAVSDSEVPSFGLQGGQFPLKAGAVLASSLLPVLWYYKINGKGYVFLAPGGLVPEDCRVTFFFSSEWFEAGGLPGDFLFWRRKRRLSSPGRKFYLSAGKRTRYPVSDSLSPSLLQIWVPFPEKPGKPPLFGPFLWQKEPFSLKPKSGGNQRKQKKTPAFLKLI